MKAQVAYENAREARRKLKAVKPLRWHRMDAEGRYEAKGERGRYVLMSRSPNRRKGIFPWTVLAGGLRGPEIKTGGFDLKSDAATFASQYDAGLCGAPAVVVQAPTSQGLPPGVYKGTAAEARDPSKGYASDVLIALNKMGIPKDAEVSNDYVAQMEDAGIDPAITAAVIAGTVRHRHDHNCAGKHVELAEGGAREDRAGGDTYKVQYKDMTGVTWVDFVQAGGVDDAERIARAHAMKFGHPVHSAVGVQRASEEESAAAEGGSKKFLAAKAALAPYNYGLQKTGHGDYRVYPIAAMRDPEVGYFTDDLDDAVATGKHMAGQSAYWTGTAESKKRLPQPDPSSGYYITHSSLTRDLWLMHEDRLVARSTNRGELLKKAEQLSESSEAAEARRPKGRRHR